MEHQQSNTYKKHKCGACTYSSNHRWAVQRHITLKHSKSGVITNDIYKYPQQNCYSYIGMSYESSGDKKT